MILQYEPLIGDEEKKAVSDYMNSGGWLTEHKKTRELEQNIADFLGRKYCFMMPNGTISLSIALLAYGIKLFDAVIVPSLSMIATANAVTFIGVYPVFTEIEKESLTIDVDLLIKLVEKSKECPIKAIIYTSLNGRQGNIEKLIDYCFENNIPLIEDAAQSFGSIKTNAPISSYSFSMPKIITMGQGGCLTTDNNELASKIKKLRDFGRKKGGNDIHDYFGINCKFTDLQSVIGIEQLKQIDKRINKKKEIYKKYYNLLKEIKEIEWIPTDENVTPWFVDIYIDNREKLIEYLNKHKIETRKIYPPMYSQKCYNLPLGYSITESYCKRGLWLPSSLTLKNEEIRYICDTIKKFYRKEVEK